MPDLSRDTQARLYAISTAVQTVLLYRDKLCSILWDVGQNTYVEKAFLGATDQPTG